MNLLIDIFIIILDAYFYMIVFYILLGWIQEIRKSGFYRLLGIIVEPFFRVFRGWLVFSGLDFTPMLGLFLYQMLVGFLVTNI